jgi:hypothetical protein
LCQPVFVDILSKKKISRSAILKDFSSYTVQVQSVMPTYPECVARVTRCHRVKLVTKFVEQSLCDIYFEA